MEEQLDRRIGIAMQKKVFGSRELSKKAKVEVYNAMVVPMLTYVCESWVQREREKTRLQASGMSVLRKIAGVTKVDCIRNEEIRHRLQQRSIVELLKES